MILCVSYQKVGFFSQLIVANHKMVNGLIKVMPVNIVKVGILTPQNVGINISLQTDSKGFKRTR
jgi:hypothetical protein